VEFRVAIQKKATPKNKYYPKLVSATTQDQCHFSVPSADIEIVTNTQYNTSGYISPIRYDDYIRLQVSIKMNPNEKTVWTDIFNGTIQSIDSSIGESGNTAKLHCVGFMDEVLWTPIQENLNLTDSHDAREYFDRFINVQGYHRYLKYSNTYAQVGVLIPSYSTTINQTFFSDVIEDMEKMSGYHFRAYALPIYDSQGNVYEVYLAWKQLSSVVTDKYKVIEGTHRYISSEFSSSIEDLANIFTVIGASNGASPYVGESQDSSSIALYGTRKKVESQNWILSNAQANAASDGLLSDAKSPVLVGKAVLIGTPACNVGDLVYCKSPSQEVSGSTIDANMTVYRVSHNISASGYTTTLDLGRIKKSAYDYIGYVVKTVKTNKKNSCRR
jgi:hypothetical protein